MNVAVQVEFKADRKEPLGDLFMFRVRGPGFNATLMPPVTTGDQAPQYPIGDTGNWTKIVANLAAIVDELERTFVAEIEAAVDPAPAWFEPGK